MTFPGLSFFIVALLLLCSSEIDDVHHDLLHLDIW